MEPQPTSPPTHDANAPHTNASQSAAQTVASDEIEGSIDEETSRLLSNSFITGDTRRSLLSNWLSRSWISHPTPRDLASEAQLQDSIETPDQESDAHTSDHVSIQVSPRPSASYHMTADELREANQSNIGLAATNAGASDATISNRANSHAINMDQSQTVNDQQHATNIPTATTQAQPVDDMIELRPYLLWLAQGSPFIVLMAVLYIYQHITGLSIFFMFLYLFYRSDTMIRHQVSLKAERNLHHTSVILSILLVLFCLIQFFCIEKRSILYIFLGIPEKPDFYTSLWIFVMNDFILTNSCMITKVILIMAFGSRFPHRRNGQMYAAIEGFFRLMKLVAPIPVWNAYLVSHYDDTVVTSTIAIMYPVLKVYDLGIRINLYAITLKKIIEDEVWLPSQLN
eukprot:TRINITY_DN3504_c0_g1_i8.p1 TRINITY_DN3504_c0_g1~~TRINITY_DN3504_c0_g1_i8.p1  ORF type:complete len:399 (-),score=79.46 TRINITY_DN3504_c0_g1_i8:141-1337(-)